jgi:pSer/pThr/pTyr-binding forkhead associated (FHA) protein
MIDRETRMFQEASGCFGPLIVGVLEPGVNEVSWRCLDHPFAVLGSDPNSDIVLKARGVSRRHAYLQVIAGRLYCIDLESRNGTYWNEQIGLCGWVDPGTRVQIDGFQILARDQDFDRDRASQADQPSRTELVPTGNTSISRTLVLIGSSPDCKIRLPSDRVASFHASLVKTPAGIFVVDLLAPGGIRVNGEKVRCARIGPEDELKVGKHRFRLQTDPSAKKFAVKSESNLPISSRGDRTDLVPLDSTESQEFQALAKMMLEEFGRIQQQTADRFEQTLLTVVKTLATGQQEQIRAMIREELSGIREPLSRQLPEKEQILIETRKPGREAPPKLRLVSGEARPKEIIEEPHKPTRSFDLKEQPVPPSQVAQKPEPKPPVRTEESENFHQTIFDRLDQIQGKNQGGWLALARKLMGQ